MSERIVPRKTYYTVFVLLMALTASTVGIALIDLGPFNTIAALLIAGIKATLVIMFFMHVRYSRKIIPLVLLGGLMWLAILIGLTLTDFLSRTWLPTYRGW